MGIAVHTDCLGKDKILLFHEASKPLLDLLMQLFASTLFHSRVDEGNPVAKNDFSPITLATLLSRFEDLWIWIQVLLFIIYFYTEVLYLRGQLPSDVPMNCFIDWFSFMFEQSVCVSHIERKDCKTSELYSW